MQSFSDCGLGPTKGNTLLKVFNGNCPIVTGSIVTIREGSVGTSLFLLWAFSEAMEKFLSDHNFIYRSGLSISSSLADFQYS